MTRSITSTKTIFTTLAALLLALAVGGPAAASAPASERLQASLSRSVVSEGEPVELHLRTPASSSSLHVLQGAATPDLAPLEEDFRILGVRQVAQTTVINGRAEQTHEWVVELLPLRTGVGEIPSISLGGDPATASAPLSLVVSSVAATPSPSRRPLASRDDEELPSTFVEASVDDEAPYVQGQVMLRVRLLSREPILSGQLSDVEVPGATVERVGEDRSSETTRNGIPYSVIERSFAISPQQSGELRIAPVIFEGQVRDDSPRRGLRRGFGGLGSRQIPSMFGGDLFAEIEAMMGDDFFGPRGRSVVARSEPLALNVRPRPENAEAYWWLPADALSLSEQWDREPETLVVGEQVTRSFVIEALGVARDQIPDLELPEVVGLKQYREPAVDETIETKDGLAAVKVQKTVVIPTAPGDYVLPAVELAWWDISTDEQRTETIPERRIRVVAAVGDPADQHAGTPVPASPSGPTEPPAGSISAKPAATPSDLASSPRWTHLRRDVSIAAAIALSLGLALYFNRGRLFGRVRRERRSDATRPAAAREPGAAGLRGAQHALERACREGDSASALQALRAIATAHGPDSTSMGPEGFAARIGDPALSDEISALQRARFAAHGEAWDGSKLWRAYRRALVSSPGADAQSEKRRSAPLLPGLYPSSSA